VDQGRLEEQGAPSALSARPRALLRPTRFDPPVLAPVKSSRDVRDQHADQLAAAMAVAREEGLRLARAEVAAAVAHHEQAARRLEQLTQALSAAVDQVRGHDREAIDAVQHQAVMFGVAVAEELLGRELRSCDDTVTAAIERAVSFVPDRGEIILRVSPTDLEVASAFTTQFAPLAERVRFEPDPAIGRGGCVAVVGPLRIDAQLAAALDRVRAVTGS
jgi:flagellar assembly protein FliH